MKQILSIKTYRYTKGLGQQIFGTVVVQLICRADIDKHNSARIVISVGTDDQTLLAEDSDHLKFTRRRLYCEKLRLKVNIKKYQIVSY